VTRRIWFVVAALWIAPASAAGAVEGEPLSDGWPAGDLRVSLAEGAVIAGLSAGALLVQALKAPDNPRWTGGILFDDGVRNALRASSARARTNAGTASDIGYVGLALYPVIIDAGLVVWLGKGRADAAVQLALIDIEAIALTGLTTTLVQRTVGRARPFTRNCASDPRDCGSNAIDRNTSFVSGHASVAFTAATTLCMQHSRLSLYGAADKAVCPIALAVASATAVLRIVADKHYASDVLAGAAIGAAVGASVNALHLRVGDGKTRGLSGTREGRGLAYFIRF
jgi:membrane-associated phospholipid phosphatase